MVIALEQGVQDPVGEPHAPQDLGWSLGCLPRDMNMPVSPVYSLLQISFPSLDLMTSSSAPGNCFETALTYLHSLLEHWVGAEGWQEDPLFPPPPLLGDKHTGSDPNPRHPKNEVLLHLMYAKQSGGQHSLNSQGPIRVQSLPLSPIHSRGPPSPTELTHQAGLHSGGPQAVGLASLSLAEPRGART